MHDGSEITPLNLLCLAPYV